MRKLLIAASLLALTYAGAQAQQATPAPTRAFHFTDAQTDVIWNALRERPAKDVYEVMVSIQVQTATENAARAEANKPKVETPSDGGAK